VDNSLLTFEEWSMDRAKPDPEGSTKYVTAHTLTSITEGGEVPLEKKGENVVQDREGSNAGTRSDDIDSPAKSKMNARKVIQLFKRKPSSSS